MSNSTARTGSSRPLPAAAAAVAAARGRRTAAARAGARGDAAGRLGANPALRIVSRCDWAAARRARVRGVGGGR